MTASTHDPARLRLDSWAVREGADEPSRLIFLSLDHELREQVRGMGKLNNARNPSSLLISRIKSVCNDYVVLDTEAQIVWDSNAAQLMRDYGIHNTEKRIIILAIRGETHRTGGNKQHRTDGLIEEFILNLESYMEFLVDPLELSGHSVLCCGDLVCAEGDGKKQEAHEAFRSVFGKRVIDLRVQPHMHGPNQVSSLHAVWDHFQHAIDKRRTMVGNIGTFFLRADCRLKHLGMAAWPESQKISYFWWTYCSKIHGWGNNDIAIYVPKDLYELFRKCLSQAPTKIAG